MLEWHIFSANNTAWHSASFTSFHLTCEPGKEHFHKDRLLFCALKGVISWMEEGTAWTETVNILRINIFTLNILVISKNFMTYLK